MQMDQVGRRPTNHTKKQRRAQHRTLMVESHEAETNVSLATRFQSTLDASAVCSAHCATGKSSPGWVCWGWVDG